MIQIDISEEKMKKIENLHWEWFKEKKLKNWITRIKKDKNFQIALFDNIDFDEWFDINKRESDSKWFERQEEQKFDIFRKIIIEKERLNRGKINEDIDFSYFNNQYEDFRLYKADEWNGVNLIKEIGLTTCPYCNRSYITIIEENNGNLKATAQLDHFYSKKYYPYLALSLYNLIPVCGTCNHIKLDSEKDLINPYKDGFKTKARFTLDLGNSKLIEKYDLNVLLGISDNLYINLDIDNNLNTVTKLKIENSIETFKLKEIYSINHRDYVKDLIRKAIIYNQSRIDELYSQYGELFSSREEVWTMVLGNYIESDDLGKRPLAKLTKDIMEELGIK